MTRPLDDTWEIDGDGDVRNGHGVLLFLRARTGTPKAAVTLACAAPDMARALLAFIRGLDGSECAKDVEDARLDAEAALTKAGVKL